jgi:hypothetical protein
MVTHFYDSSTDSPDIQHIRLKPARAITDAQIPCSVWAEDALSFAHPVPTALFALQVLVPDEDLDAASSAITSRLPYVRIRKPAEDWLEHRFIDSSRPSCFPNSIYLTSTNPSFQCEDDPKAIYIHPQSFFSVNVRNHDLSITLVPPLPATNAQVRFPTRIAFLDSLIDTLLDPPIGFRHWKLTQSMQVYISYLRTYTLRPYPRVLPDGDLEPEHDTVLKSLKAENRQYFDRLIRGTSLGWFPEVQDRRVFLQRAG